LMLYDIAICYKRTILMDDVNVGRILLTVKEKNNIKGFVEYLPEIVVSFYLLNPYTILSCVSMSTVILNNFCVIASLFFIMRKYLVFACFFNALASYLTLYPFILMAPIVIIYQRLNNGSIFNISMRVISLFTFFSSCLILVSYVEL